VGMAAVSRCPPASLYAFFLGVLASYANACVAAMCLSGSSAVSTHTRRVLSVCLVGGVAGAARALER
jgi:hypothetical protein